MRAKKTNCCYRLPRIPRTLFQKRSKVNHVITCSYLRHGLQVRSVTPTIFVHREQFISEWEKNGFAKSHTTSTPECVLGEACQNSKYGLYRYDRLSRPFWYTWRAQGIMFDKFPVWERTYISYRFLYLSSHRELVLKVKKGLLIIILKSHGVQILV